MPVGINLMNYAANFAAFMEERAGDSDEPYEASHAWAEAYIEDLGWVGFDPANGVSSSDVYVRTAVGLDYQTAAPVRGLRRGLAAEDMAVEVQIAAAAGDQ